MKNTILLEIQAAHQKYEGISFNDWLQAHPGQCVRTVFHAESNRIRLQNCVYYVFFSRFKQFKRLILRKI